MKRQLLLLPFLARRPRAREPAQGCRGKGRAIAAAQPLVYGAEPPLAASDTEQNCRQTPAVKIVLFSCFIQNVHIMFVDPFTLKKDTVDLFKLAYINHVNIDPSPYLLRVH